MDYNDVRLGIERRRYNIDLDTCSAIKGKINNGDIAGVSEKTRERDGVLTLSIPTLSGVIDEKRNAVSARSPARDNA